MKCPQCNSCLVEPSGLEKYCEECGFPDENLAKFTLIEIKAYLRSMFEKQNCMEDIRLHNHMLACAYNLLLDDNLGIAAFCSEGKADGITLYNLAHANM
jgi:hypothetical protein